MDYARLYPTSGRCSEWSTSLLLEQKKLSILMINYVLQNRGKSSKYELNEQKFFKLVHTVLLFLVFGFLIRPLSWTTEKHNVQFIQTIFRSWWWVPRSRWRSRRQFLLGKQLDLDRFNTMSAKILFVLIRCPLWCRLHYTALKYIL